MTEHKYVKENFLSCYIIIIVLFLALIVTSLFYDTNIFKINIIKHKNKY